MTIQRIASGKYALELLTTHHFGLPGVDLAIKSTGGTAPSCVSARVRRCAVV